MGQQTLTAEQKKGVKACIFVVMLVLVLFTLLLVGGRPIMDFRTQAPSVAYGVLVYIPVVALCILAYRRLG